MKARGLWKNSEESERVVEEQVRLIELLNLKKHLHQCGRRDGCGRGFGSYPILWCTSVRLLLPTTSGVTIMLLLPLSAAAFCFFCSSSLAFFAASNSSRSSILSSILVGVLLNILKMGLYWNTHVSNSIDYGMSCNIFISYILSMHRDTIIHTENHTIAWN